jgi:trimethylamine:corrinoid methyltransferase-like protein
MHDTLRPRLELFANEAIDRIIDQAIEVLNDVGIRVEDGEARALLQEGGAQVRGERCFVSKDGGQ